MGCFCSKRHRSNIRIYGYLPPVSDHCRPNGKIILSMDRKYNAPVFDLEFNGWNEKSVRIWPKHTENCKYSMLADRISLQSCSSDEYDIDTFF